MKNILLVVIFILVLSGCEERERRISVEGTVVIATMPVGKNGRLAYYLEIPQFGVERVSAKHMREVGDEISATCEVAYDRKGTAYIVRCYDK